jgi:hypothetical protein
VGAELSKRRSGGVSFIALGWFDVYELACSLRSRIGLFPKSGDARTLSIYGPRGDADPEDATTFTWAKGYDKWPELMNVLGEIERIGNRALVDIEWGRINLELLMPSGIIPLESDGSGYAEKFDRAHLAIRTNPAAVVFCGLISRNIASGEAVVLGTKRAPRPPLPVGAFNAGESPRCHLIVDFRKKDQPE